MNALAPLEALYELDRGVELPLPPALAALYGPLRFPPQRRQPYVFGNFVATLDGVVSLGVPGHAGGGEISGFNQHDRFVMGLLRAVADAVIVGAGTLRAVPEHRWTAAYIAPAYAEAYQELRAHLGKPEPPLNVIVTARGSVSLDLPVFQSGEVPVLIVTTRQGEERIRTQRVPPPVQIAAVQHAGILPAQAIVQAVCG